MAKNVLLLASCGLALVGTLLVAGSVNILFGFSAGLGVCIGLVGVMAGTTLASMSED